LDIELDLNGWPVTLQWPDMEKPLFANSPGDFLSLEITTDRGTSHTVWHEKDRESRLQKVEQATKEIWATPIEKARVDETPYSFIYEQKLNHPRLRWATRKLEIWKNEPRVRLKFTFDRLSSSDPEIFYITFTLAETDAFPLASTGGVEFSPYKDQIPGTCTDYFVIDGWVQYPSSTSGSWIWSSRESPFIAFDSPQFAVKAIDPPDHMNKILAMVYNNLWFTNFNGNCPGVMEFQFDLVWKDNKVNADQVAELVQTYYVPPVVMVNPKEREHEDIYKRMNEVKTSIRGVE
jgi:hypothetical protein